MIFKRNIILKADSALDLIGLKEGSCREGNRWEGILALFENSLMV